MGARTERAWLAWLSCERRTETTRNVHSALWHRRATVRARVLAVIPCGLSPLLGAGADSSRSRCPSAVTTLAAQAFSKKMRPTRAPSTGRQAGARSEALTASAPVAGGRITELVINVKLCLCIAFVDWLCAIYESKPNDCGPHSRF